MQPVVFYFGQPVESSSFEWLKMRELSRHVDGFRHDHRLIDEHEIDPTFDVQDAYSFLAPMIDTDAYLTWLAGRACALGVELTYGEVTGPLDAEVAALRQRFGAQVVVNCSGLGASVLAGDRQIRPLRGALVRARNDGSRTPPINVAHAMTYTGRRGQDMIFIVPRGERTLLLGGLVEPDCWDTDISLQSPAVADMVERCRRFLPALRAIEVDIAEPVRVGLRPHRDTGPRVGADRIPGLFHTYGHGGSGITWSWGCAGDVVRLIDGACEMAVAA